ncbi:MAG: PaaI family thioesterase [Gammaproteobacteria bacterium]
MTELAMSIQQMNERLATQPYNRWMGAQVVAYENEALILEVPWRDEFIGTVAISSAHGGVLAAIIDLTGSYTIATRTGKPIPTIDLQIDYVRPAIRHTIRAEGRIVKIGRTFSVANATLLDPQGRLLATGRGLYYTAEVSAGAR